MTPSDCEGKPVLQCAYVADSDDPRVQDLPVLTKPVSDLVISLIAASGGLNDIRLDLLKMEAAEAEYAGDDDSESGELSVRFRARYDCEISIRTGAQDVERFRNLADERGWSYGRMFQELLKVYGKSGDAI